MRLQCPGKSANGYGCFDKKVPEPEPLETPESETAGGVETARTLVQQRRVETALRGLPSGQYGAEGALLRLKCFIHLRKFGDAAKECETEELRDSFEAQLFLAQAPYLLRADGFGALRKLQELSEAWRKKGPESMDLRLKLLQVFSQLSLQMGHGHLGLTALLRAIEDGGEAAGPRQLWSLLGRHHLSWGNLRGAKEAFETARSLTGQEPTLFLNEGLLAMANGDYAQARGFFESAAESSSDPEEALAAENNLAVCKFYTKDLQGACQRLEALVKQDALRFLKPCLLQNLVSLYEFSQEAALKRQELHALAKTAQLEDLDPQLFKAPQMGPGGTEGAEVSEVSEVSEAATVGDDAKFLAELQKRVQEVNAQERERRERIDRNWRTGRAKAQPAAIIQELPGMVFHGYFWLQPLMQSDTQKKLCLKQLTGCLRKLKKSGGMNLVRKALDIQELVSLAANAKGCRGHS
eukprot:s2982_g7.t1